MRRATVVSALLVAIVLLPFMAKAQDPLAQAKVELAAAYKQAEKVRAAGKTREAADLYEKLIARATQLLGKDHLWVATYEYNLGWIYVSQKKYPNAERVFKRSLEIREAKLAKDSLEIASSLHSLADVYRNTKQTSRAESLYRRSLAMREAKLGKDHIDVAVSLNQLAVVYDGLGQHTKAIPLYKRSLEIREAKLGKNHIDLVIPLTNLAWAYKSTKQYSRAETLYKRSLHIREAKHGMKHLDVALSLNLLGFLYEAMKQQAKAEPLFRRALEIREAKLGKDHLDVASSLNQLGVLYDALGQHTKSEPLYKRSLEIREAKLGKNHIDLITPLNNLAWVYKTTGQYSKSETLYKRSLHIREAKKGKDHLDVALSLNLLAFLYETMEQHAKAEPLLKQALDIRETRLGKDHLDVAFSLTNLANVHKSLGQYTTAEPLYRRCLDIREARLGKDHLEVATAVNNLASLYDAMGRYTRAEAMYKRSLAIRETKLGKDDLVVGVSANNLGNVYKNMGQYARAEPLLKRSLQIKEAKLSKDHLEVGTALHNLAMLYERMGHFGKAEAMYKRGLEIREAKLGKDHLHVAFSLNGLAMLYRRMGQFAKVEPLYKRGQAIYEAKLGKDHIEVATNLNNLAVLFKSLGQDAKAEPLYRRSLEIYEAKLGKNHPSVATTVNNLGSLYSDMGQYAKAEPLCKRSLEIREAMLGKDHPDVAYSLSSLAWLYVTMGQYVKAEPLFKRCLAIREARLPKEHPDLTDTLTDMGMILALTQGDDAARFFHRSRQASRRHVASVLPALSESEQLDFLQRNDRGKLKRALSLPLATPGDAEIANFSAGWLINGKGQAQESLARSALLARDSKDPAKANLVAELLRLRRRMTTLSVAAPKPGKEKDFLLRRESLSKQEQEIGRKLRQAGSTAIAAEWVELSDIRRRLPVDGVLIDVVRMDVYDYNAKPGTKKWRPARYVAWLTPSSGKVQVVDLGLASKIDFAVNKLRQTLKDAPGIIKTHGEPEAEKTIRADLQRLSTLVLDPLLPHAKKSAAWLVSPDANLCLIPWQMMLLPDGKYALEKYRISYLNSGRNLAPRSPAKVKTTQALVMADPDFDLDATGVKTSARRLLGNGEPEENTRSLSSLMKLGAVLRLPGTAIEARAITPALLAYTKHQPRVLTGKDAVKAVFQATRNPRVLVLCTHGFFLTDKQAAQEATTISGGGKRPGAGLENPLLRCGLLMAGCNQGGKAAALEGVLTGLEVLGTDLRGCELVALSACETGLGKVYSGEGVIGLRQAFQMAGAEAVVSTLWQVPDRQSAQLMTLFFTNLSKGMGKAEALRQAQIKVIEERRDDFAAAHPFFWAAFTLTGR